ncbi:hypothetical protein I4U23_015924 [Adineta vaga]|nr:hypothetical protein I4U23_015924 [Adineta vaga]
MVKLYTRCYLIRKKKSIIALVLGSILIIYYAFFQRTSNCSYLCPYKSIESLNLLTFDDSHMVENYPEFICPQNFRNLADWVYGWPYDVFEEHLEVTTTKGHYIKSCLPTNSIIYVKADHLGEFFHKVYPQLVNKFILISGQSDVSSPGPYLSYLERYDSKIVHWFGQNSEIHSSENNKFTPIPIGINCYLMANALRLVQRLQHAPVINIKPNYSSIYHVNQTLLINFKQSTDPTGIRSHVWSILCNNSVTSKFTLCIDKPDGVNISILPTIYARNRRYPLWLSPRGNGLDCHRTWEALYLNVIPIVWNSTLNSLYTNLPIIVINNEREINEEFLRIKLKEITALKAKTQSIYDLEKLQFSYWRRLILNKSRHSSMQTIRNNQCWRAKTTINSGPLQLTLNYLYTNFFSKFL